MLALTLTFVGVSLSACAIADRSGKPAPLVIQEQGSFAVGGTVITNPGTFDPVKMTPEGQTFHGDHAYVFYQVPVNARKLASRALAWLRAVLEDLGNDTGWTRGLSKHFPAPRFRGLCDRPAPSRQCRTQHPADHLDAGAR